MPSSVIIIGGGAIGVELAQVFARFGVMVTMVEVADRLIAAEEPESSTLLTDIFGREGIQVLGVTISSVSYDDGQFAVTLGEQVVTAEKLLVAAGRRTNLTNIGLETVGLDPSERTLETDARLRAAEGLWAIGDITGKGAFTHVSMYQGAIVVRDILGREGPGADYPSRASCDLHDPEVGSVGLTEQQAREGGRAVRVGFTELPSSTRGWIPQGGQRRFHQAGGGRRARGTRGGHLGGPTAAKSCPRSAIHAEVPTSPALDDLRLPDVPPGDRGRARQVLRRLARAAYRGRRRPALARPPCKCYLFDIT